MNLIDRDLRNARLLKPNIRVSPDKPRKLAIWESVEEWFCAIVCTAAGVFVVWLLVQLWNFLTKQGG